MIRTQISVDRNLYEQARVLAKQEGISLAELCRRSLRDFVGQRTTNKPWMAYAGLLEGEENASSTVDEVVHGGDRV